MRAMVAMGCEMMCDRSATSVAAVGGGLVGELRVVQCVCQ
jgi:hypothetical protein